jgi:PAS domain S-box-containing protein
MPMDEVMRDLLEMIDFTQNVAVKIHGVLEEAEIYRVVGEEFAKSKRYEASIVLLTNGGSKLSVLQTSLPGKKVTSAEKATGLRLQGYRIDLNKSSICSQVVREGRTITARSRDILSEWLPRPLVALILKILGYENRTSVLAPLSCNERIVGAIVVSCAAFDESVVPSVKNLAQHISTALTLADQTAKRLQAEQAVRESEGRFRQMAAVIPVVFWMFSPDWMQAIYVSPAVEQIYGRTRESFYQQPALWLAVMHPEDRERAAAFRRQQPAQDAEHEYRIVRPDGQVRWIRNVASPVRNEAGDLVSLTGFLEDITARKEAEQASQISEEYFRALIEDASDVVVTLDSDGVLRYVSPSVQKRWGYAPTALVGTNAAQYCHPDDRLQLADALDRVRQRPGASTSVELRFRDAEGSWRILRGEARNLMHNPAVGGIVVNVADITDQRRTEAQLAQADKLASLGVLAGGTAAAGPSRRRRAPWPGCEEYRYCCPACLWRH